MIWSRNVPKERKFIRDWKKPGNSYLVPCRAFVECRKVYHLLAESLFHRRVAIGHLEDETEKTFQSHLDLMVQILSNWKRVWWWVYRWWWHSVRWPLWNWSSALEHHQQGCTVGHRSSEWLDRHYRSTVLDQRTECIVCRCRFRLSSDSSPVCSLYIKNKTLEWFTTANRSRITGRNRWLAR